MHMGDIIMSTEMSMGSPPPGLPLKQGEEKRWLPVPWGGTPSPALPTGGRVAARGDRGLRATSGRTSDVG